MDNEDEEDVEEEEEDEEDVYWDSELMASMANSAASTTSCRVE